MPAEKEQSDTSGGLSAPVQGALLMLGAAACFSVMIVLIRKLSAELDPLQIAFFRNFFALLFILPWLARSGASKLRTRRLGLHVWRALFGLAAMVTWFYSVSLLPLAEAVALNFTVPLFATMGAAFILGEAVRARRWSATIVGFLGALVILRPGFTEVTPLMSLPILSALLMAVTVLVVKSLSGTEHPNAIVLYMNLMLTPLSLIPALFVWRWPAWEILPWLVLLGGLATAAHLFLTRAYAKADASAVMPLDYARLPLVALLGFLLFGEAPDHWTWIGGAVIAASAIYITRREAQVARERAVAGVAAAAPQGRD